MQNTVCVFHDTTDFMTILRAVKDFVAQDDTRPLQQLIFLRGETVSSHDVDDHHYGQLTAIALNGYCLSREILPNPGTLTPFAGFLSVPRYNPTKNDRVFIEQNSLDKSLTLCYQSHITNQTVRFHTPVPQGAFDEPEIFHERLWKQAERMTSGHDFYVGLNAKYLMDAAKSITPTRGFRNARLPVILSGKTPVTAVSVNLSPYSQRVILPVRVKQPDYIATKGETPMTVYGLYKEFPGNTIRNADGDNLGDAGKELVSLHLSESFALEAKEAAESDAEELARNLDYDMPVFSVEPIPVETRN